MPKKKSKKVKKNGKGVGGKADVHAHEEGKRNKSLEELCIRELQLYQTQIHI